MSMFQHGHEPTALIAAIATKLIQAQLPREWPTGNRGSWGTGQPCAACGDAIFSDQAQVEADFRNGETQPFHVRCFVQWWDLVEANGGGLRDR